jgi:proteasome lid subunit RPN8/RPN11
MIPSGPTIPGRNLSLNHELVTKLFELAAEGGDREICGFLLGDMVNGLPDTILPVKNIAKDPLQEYEMDPVAVRELWKYHRHEIVGTYHSHPHGVALCSGRDKMLIRATRLSMAIISVSTNEIRLFGMWDADSIRELEKYHQT